MNLYINDFSYRPLEQGQDCEAILKEFLNVCEGAKKYSFEKLCMPSNFKALEIVQGFSIATFLESAPKNSPLRQRLNSLVANQLKKIDQDELMVNKIQYVAWNGRDSEFFRRAFNSEVPVVSFTTNTLFSSDRFQIINKFLDKNEEILEIPGIVYNIGSQGHITTHHHILSQKQLQYASLQGRWNALAEPLRFSLLSTQYLQSIGFEAKWGKASPEDRVTLADFAGDYIAQLNGWEYRSKLSAFNQRRVYQALNQSVYLSIDTMHRAFEVHDRNGFHHGEISFGGEWLEDAQSKKLKLH